MVAMKIVVVVTISNLFFNLNLDNTTFFAVNGLFVNVFSFKTTKICFHVN